ncbi:hypothetical protein [Candidatus Vampirococcus lugosii]|uniref:Uncharacterized protein n=1 Tax=Candidatus Vampirococcus lugosii TaxID=2789015 RepID=A0ABS5QMF7_9BACT|nr:hypothetical protein [Candidatus Vampirococcus lugosii]MBS8122328.1 hypothetical protein [Candidatus Vampirococcus lugosii]
MKKTIFISLVLGAVLLSGCFFEKDINTKETTPIIKNEENKQIQDNQNLKSQIEDIQKNKNIITDNSTDSENQTENSQSLYRNNDFGFEFNYPSSWKISNEIKDSEIEGLVIKPKLYLKLDNTSDFKVRNFNIVFMIISEEESKMPAGMVFNETTKSLINKNGEKLFINIVAESIMGGDPWPGKENEVKNDTELFEKQWTSIVDSIKPKK